MHELVIRGGTVVDGTGADARTADVAVDEGRITEVGQVEDAGQREVDADGLAVLPGWVDVHTHYDGQATWDQELAPSSWHGVTTAVFGNCAVGFAPVAPGREPFLISLMQGVEDIPGTVLAEGIDFRWESFPEYLDVLASTERAIDVGAQVPHAALRFYVMGERGADHGERPTPDEVARMGRLAVEGVQAGAFGFTTSRTEKHRAADGRFTPSLSADEHELLGIARALGEAGVGVLQANIDYGAPEDWTLLRAMAEVSGRPTWFSLLQEDEHPDRWRELLDEVARANADGLTMRAQVGSRAIGVLFGFDATANPFLTHPTYLALAGLPLPERVAELRRPEVRERLLSEHADGGFAAFLQKALDKTFRLGDPPDYEPHPDENLMAQARRQGLDPQEVLLDALLEDDGRALLYFPFENYGGGSLDGIREMLLDPNTVSGLSDGGAHVGTICDASYPTTLLTHWVRDRTRGERLPLEHVVHRQTQASAEAIGLFDRGVVRPGLRADLNVVDLAALRLHAPEMVYDLPAGGKRLVQRVDGYRSTWVAGTEVMVDGEWTGATPGRLVRGPQPA
jgi:N-acyl-D-aspartate/D-glutamate deacylase